MTFFFYQGMTYLSNFQRTLLFNDNVFGRLTSDFSVLHNKMNIGLVKSSDSAESTTTKKMSVVIQPFTVEKKIW